MGKFISYVIIHTISDVTLIIKYGTDGGAPPYRHFLGKTYDVQVNPTDNYATLMNKIKQKTGKLYNRTPINIDFDKSKTVAENGLKNGSVLQFSDGSVD